MNARLVRTLALIIPCVFMVWCLAPAQLRAQPADDPRNPLTPKPRPTSSGVGAGEFTITIEGVKQGRFKGEGPIEANKDKLVGVGFSYEIRTPRDPATGLATGKRQHQPLVFTKEWGAASPQLFLAAATNEILRSVMLDFHQAVAGKGAEIFYTIKLTNASIVSIRQYQEHGKYLEDVSLTFSKIEVEHRASKTTASDEWSK